MTEKLQAIVLGCVRHSDRAQIANVYTRTRGRISLLVPAGASRAVRRQAAMLMPLSLIEFECRGSAASELWRPSGMTFLYTYRDIYFNPQKNAIGIFLSEFLGRLLRVGPPDAILFRFIADSLITLDSLQSDFGNFHITFLSGLTAFMGISPDLESYAPGLMFDMRAGGYTPLHPGHNDILIGDNARMPLILNRLNYSNMHLLRLRRYEREKILEGLLHYWGIHFPGTSTLRSMEVLSELFV